MLFLLVRKLLEWLEAHDLGFLRVFTFPTFQSVVSVMVAFLMCVLLGPGVIEWLRRQRIGDQANFDQEQLNAIMAGKKGTPTMGGVLIIAAITVAVLLLADLRSFYVQMALLCLVWLGGVGAVDDWLKLTSIRRAAKAEAEAKAMAAGTEPGAEAATELQTRVAAAAANGHGGVGNGDSVVAVAAPPAAPAAVVKRPAAPVSRQGLTSLEKLLFQIGLGVLLSYFTFMHGRDVDVAHTLYFPFFKNAKLVLNLAEFVALGTLMLVGFSNAVNLTDGLDGLAAGCMGIVSFAFLVLSLIVGIPGLASYLLFDPFEPAGQMAVVAGAMTGACLGFLWFNCNPARVFMGDTGSLALGGLIGYVALVIRQELVLIMVGGIFVAEAVSVMLQVGYFKYTRRRFGEGRRIFLMAPLHHHFQRKGWTETQVVVRFWLIGAMLAAMALVTVKLR
jgi:phospho-N-acetylmuramoyl-pentapeptide-transferase